ncbi:2-keto-4-pentenoate hydratase [Aurantiacibacter rhizosphaerae]|uniref:2-keto-4-pentenoate hydratase n=1 Tax=Aurantiacibacter rhizosphaerae TaxID=2691582 RepID=A0A844XH51_9SPHN|nr:2-keto-4-pentenoate hydratase [Aurantiacibacter rhizosphaerae]MWV29069.1 2-keto-4-pentenoate hydratase [Aurantiacibacter rhizosphaerae]
MNNQAITKAAETIATARRSCVGLPSYPGETPANLADAYAVQSAAMSLWAEPVAGWKVGRISGDQERVHGENRFIGPIYSPSVWSIGLDDPAAFPVIRDGSAALEAELIACIEVPDGDLQREWTGACIPSIIRSWHIGIEVAGSPLANIGDLGPLVSIAAFGNNIGLLLGPELRADTDIDSVNCTVSIAGKEHGPQSAGALPGGPHEAVAFALKKLRALGHRVPAGTLISTGAITGVHPVAPDQDCRALFSPGGNLQCRTQALATKEGQNPS